ncbi:MAG: 1-deoxy-D-xylulose-5-phosphate reductoisomerase [Bacteroidetes bacterium]|nr:1-deoxy-D-xylulose-5-phosphate reductoisomerase [Bacteroidota bacterium]
MRKKVVILGSTGSIGVSTLTVLRHLAQDFEVTGLITYSNHKLLNEQISEFKPAFACLIDSTHHHHLKNHPGTTIYSGREAALKLCGEEPYDILVSSLVGFAGFEPTVAAIRSGKTIALANKETLIVAGHLITDECRKFNVPLVPIDSEHSAIFQCLVGEPHHSIESVILTASGGPFLNLPVEEFQDITVERALKHPNWTMGKKITIDSASLMNKGLEVIEARWLFNIRPDQIQVVVHPQSIIHSMVQFTDGSVKAQLGVPDMKIPIQYALTYPDRKPAPWNRPLFSEMKALTFFDPDTNRFPCLRIAFESMTAGGNRPCVMNAANEVAVAAFLDGQIGFTQIPEIIQEAIDRVPFNGFPDFDAIFDADHEARRWAEQCVDKKKRVLI